MSKKEIKTLRAESPVGRIFDFPEFLSPMFVKELRQGLRSIGFTGLFIAMQALLGFIILVMLMSGVETEPDVVSVAIFTIYMIATCAIQPLRGMNAIGSEIKDDTLDLVIITKLTSWKIVYGKWFSLMAQSLIFAISLLPYLILRYFLGDMNLFSELFIFGSIFIVAAISTAVAVGSSAVKSIVLRYIISGGLVGSLFMFAYPVVIQAVERNDAIVVLFGSGAVMSAYFYVAICLLVGGAYLTWMFLDFGATMIAPISENRSTLRRLIFLGFIMIGLISSAIIRFCVDGYSLPIVLIQIMMVGIFVPFFVITFTESAFLSSRVALNITKNRLLSKIRHFVYPGWASGSWFLFPCVILLLGHTAFLIPDGSSVTTFGFTSNLDIDQVEFYFAVLTCAIGSLVFPAAVMSLFARSINNRLGIYLIILIISMVITMVITIFSATLSKDLASMFVWLPSVNIYNLVEGYTPKDKTWVAIVNLVFIAAYFAIIFIKSRFVWRHIAEQEAVVKKAIQADVSES